MTINPSANPDNPEFIDRLRCCLTFCESPIEQDFLIAAAMRMDLVRNPRDDHNGAWVATATDGERRIDLLAQFKADKYRVDFCLLTDNEMAVLVECDGHDFHDKTKAQAARDKKRDRLLVRGCGAPIIRFTGSELWRDPFACFWEAWSIATLVRP